MLTWLNFSASQLPTGDWCSQHDSLGSNACQEVSGCWMGAPIRELYLEQGRWNLAGWLNTGQFCLQPCSKEQGYIERVEKDPWDLSLLPLPLSRFLTYPSLPHFVPQQ